MICSSCGALIPPDAGFCRGCGAILRGKGASATSYAPPPSAAPVGAGYGGVVPVPPAWPPAGPSVGAPPPRTAPWLNDKASMQARYRERLHWLDIVSAAMAAAVIGSLFLPWYQIGDTLPQGPQVALSVTALDHFAGGWRWLLFVVALASLCEGVIATIARASTRGSAAHSGLQAVFGLTMAALAVACFFISPLPDLGIAGSVLGIHRSAGPGAYVGMLAALVAGGAGIARSFVAPPSVMG